MPTEVTGGRDFLSIRYTPAGEDVHPGESLSAGEGFNQSGQLVCETDYQGAGADMWTCINWGGGRSAITFRSSGLRL